MSRKIHPHKGTHPKRSPKRKPSRVFPRRYDWRTKILAGTIAATLLAGGTFAHWRANRDEVLIAKNTPNPVKNISTISQRDLADIPPDALHPQPPMAAGYNAYSGGLPPGALPPGAVLPGMPMMQGARTTGQGYGAYDGIRQQFTGKERDTETGLDYFGARYYSSAQGRFTSVDPEGEGADPEDPQSWNGYAYARNNPLKYQDPDGRKYLICNAEGKDCVSYSDAEFYRIRRESQKAYGFTGNRDFYEGGAITQDGQTIATYRQVSIDDPVREFIFESRRQTAPIPKAVAAFEGLSILGGVTGGVGLYALGPSSTVTTLGLGTAAEATETTAATTAAPQAASAIRNALSGFTKHGINSAISHDGVGVSSRAILDALKNPIKVTLQSGGRVKIVGKDATVILNQAGKVITTWARNSAGTRIP